MGRIAAQRRPQWVERGAVAVSCQQLMPEPCRTLGRQERGDTLVIVLANDDGKKMVERDGLDPFLEEYAHVTGTELQLIAAGERPDFICETSGRRHDLEVVRAMQNPLDRSWNVIFGRDGQLHGLDAAILVQDVVYRKEQTRASTGWR